MKKALHGLLNVILALLLAACCGGVAGATGQNAPNIALNNDSSKIGVMTQEYVGNNIAEILMINYNGAQPALARYGGRNPEIESFNNAIKFGIQQRYNEFMSKQQDRDWIEIKSYPFSTAEHLQIVTTAATYPSYGSDGDIASYNFNKKENRFMALADVMKELGLDQHKLVKKVKELYVPKNPSQSVEKVTATGFLVRSAPSGPLTQLLLEVVIHNSASEPWKHFFSYTPALNELFKLNADCLFDPNDMDRMDPPLVYQRQATGKKTKR
jgi:hypothetical protein